MIDRNRAAHLPAGEDPSHHDLLRRQLAVELATVRERTLNLVAPLDAAAVHHQHSPIMSPLVWDLGHIANFEALWLLTKLGTDGLQDATLDHIYNPFENPRNIRGELEFLELDDALRYLQRVRDRVLDTLSTQVFQRTHPLLRDGYIYWILIQHEAQHQETMLQALNLNETLMPYPLEVLGGLTPRVDPPIVDDEAKVEIDPMRVLVGTDDRTQAYDNERPRHPADVPAFSIGRFPVTCRRYLEFMDDGGYSRQELWSVDGWKWRSGVTHDSPQGWSRIDSKWHVRRFGHYLPVEPTAPVQHVCFYEAQACARWAQGRLPTELEWEAAASGTSNSPPTTYPWGNELPKPQRANVGMTSPGPRPVGSFSDGTSAAGCEQLIGDVYEWTSSTFAGYPGFRSFPYASYSEVFFGDQYRVLRGASWATSAHCARTTFRNWDHAIRRQIFAGFRMAWDR